MGQVNERNRSNLSENLNETEMQNRERLNMAGETLEDIMQKMEEDENCILPQGVNARYETSGHNTILEHACGVDRVGNIVEKLLERGANPDLRNTRRGVSALHMAAEARNNAALRRLLLYSRTDLNVLDSGGNNFLHTLCRQPPQSSDVTVTVLQCVNGVFQVLDEINDKGGNVRHRQLNVNHLNRQGCTPIFLAAKANNWTVVQLLLNRGCKIDMDDRHDKKTTRTLLKERGFEDDLPPQEKFLRGLVFFLYFRDEDGFLDRLNTEKQNDPDLSFLNVHDGRHTLLQTAVFEGLSGAVEALLNLGADINRTLHEEMSPCQFAAYKGFSEILERLIEKGPIQNPERAILFAIKGARGQIPLSYDFKMCFDKLLNQCSSENINIPDEDQNTPLHYAMNYEILYFVERLIEKGALLGKRGESQTITLELMSNANLLKFLNRRINIPDPLKSNNTINFDVGFLKYFDDLKIALIEEYGCQTLITLSNNQEHRSVLKHPLVGCFLFLKWNVISSLYYMYLLMHIFFFLTIVSRVLLDEYHSSSNSSSDGNLAIHEFRSKESVTYWVISLLYIFGCIFLSLDFIISIFCSYITWESLEQLKTCVLKTPLFIFSLALLKDIENENLHVIFSTFAILLSSINLVFLMGYVPIVSTYVKMLQTVTRNFAYFFLLFSPLLLAFVLSFALLFRDAAGKTFLHNLGHWTFKNLIMITGEYEAGDMMKSMTTPMCYVVFVLFVFFIAIVLFSLLNALAVSNTNAIIKDAELLATVSRINLLWNVEKFLTFIHRKAHTNFCKINSTIIKKFMGRLSLKDFVENGKITVETNRRNRLVTYGTNPPKSLYLDVNITKMAETILKSENTVTANILQDLMQTTKHIKERLESQTHDNKK